MVNKVEVDVFLELFCFFYDPTEVGNLISGSLTFSMPNQQRDQRLLSRLIGICQPVDLHL